jgi:hypothetical protein
MTDSAVSSASSPANNDDSYYGYDQKAVAAIRQAKPWLKE